MKRLEVEVMMSGGVMALMQSLMDDDIVVNCMFGGYGHYYKLSWKDSEGRVHCVSAEEGSHLEELALAAIGGGFTEVPGTKRQFVEGRRRPAT